MFSSIYYEQVALLHPPNQLASDETEEFFSKHVPHVLVALNELPRIGRNWAAVECPQEEKE